MRYESAKTAKGNVGVSWVSQELADAQAANMDAANCRGCWNCTNCTNCENCRGCWNCTNCTNCENCWNCTNCYGVLTWDGNPASNLTAINGLPWPVAISEEQIQIGCQCLTIAEWDEFYDAAIVSMDGRDALKFWRKYKSLIMAAAKIKQDDQK